MSTLTLQLDVRTCRHKLASYYGNTRTLMACSSASSCIRTAIYNTHLAAYQQKLALVSVSERSVGSNSRLAPAATTGQGEGYTTLAQPVQYEEEVKKSRFLVKAWPVQSGVEAQQRIKAASDPSASHNCFAWHISAVDSRSSDDGEPAGTAGRPILSAIEGEGLEGVCVMVTRYYGGTKLATGGLVRAYGGAARNCLREAPKAFVKRKVTLSVRVPFNCMGALYGLLDRLACTRLSEDFSAEGSLAVVCQVNSELEQKIKESVGDISKGQGSVEVVEPQ